MVYATLVRLLHVLSSLRKMQPAVWEAVQDQEGWLLDPSDSMCTRLSALQTECTFSMTMLEAIM